jgi:hypothetical protein
VAALVDELMAGAKPEVVIVGTPPESHVGYCIRGLASGAHVICEKPFVSSLAETDAGRLAQIVQNRLCQGETQYFEVRADAERGDEAAVAKASACRLSLRGPTSRAGSGGGLALVRPTARSRGKGPVSSRVTALAARYVRAGATSWRGGISRAARPSTRPRSAGAAIDPEGSLHTRLGC